MFLGAIPLILLIAFGEPIFSFLLGIQWAEAGKIASILGFNYLFMICGIATSYLRVALERQRTNLIYSIITLIFVFSSLFIGKAVSNDIITIITFYAVASTLLNIINLALNFHCIGNLTGKFVVFAGVYIVCVGSLGICVRIFIA